jgi:AmmeMemoRadiSam system protein A
MPSAELAGHERGILLRTARASIVHWLGHDEPLPVDTEDQPAPLRRRGASFVTLSIGERLRGCIGTLEPVRAIIEDVARNAAHAAGRDFRFPPVSIDEMTQLHIEISLLSAQEPVRFGNEEDLIAQLRPGIDGLIVGAGDKRATFLPSVWERLPQPADFLRELKLKARIGAGPCSDLTAWRYTTEAFGEP